jgi:hypothetical protein
MMETTNTYRTFSGKPLGKCSLPDDQEVDGRKTLEWITEFGL